MKTLDEVIKNYEICQKACLNLESCKGCSYADENDPRCRSHSSADALHYLKEYRTAREDLMKNIEDHHKAEKAYQDALKLHLYLQENNPPLTWDELRTMEGKPVWIDSVPLVRRWVIIKKFHPIGGNKNLFDMEVEDGAHFLRKSMGRDTGAWWQAYRKERK